MLANQNALNNFVPNDNNLLVSSQGRLAHINEYKDQCSIYDAWPIDTWDIDQLSWRHRPIVLETSLLRLVISHEI